VALAKVGIIKIGSRDAEGMSRSNIVKREAFDQEREEKLKNPNYSVSETRLAIRNLPKTLTLKELRKIAVEAAQNGDKKKPVKLVASKILEDKMPDGTKVSKGIAFVEYENHDDALRLLVKLNNNPQLFGPKHNPIVGFAFENAIKVRQHQLNKEKKKEMAEGNLEANGEKKTKDCKDR